MYIYVRVAIITSLARNPLGAKLAIRLPYFVHYITENTDTRMMYAGDVKCTHSTSSQNY